MRPHRSIRRSSILRMLLAITSRTRAFLHTTNSATITCENAPQVSQATSGVRHETLCDSDAVGRVVDWLDMDSSPGQRRQVDTRDIETSARENSRVMVDSPPIWTSAVIPGKEHFLPSGYRTDDQDHGPWRDSYRSEKKEVESNSMHKTDSVGMSYRGGHPQLPEHLYDDHHFDSARHLEFQKYLIHVADEGLALSQHHHYGPWSHYTSPIHNWHSPPESLSNIPAYLEHHWRYLNYYWWYLNYFSQKLNLPALRLNNPPGSGAPFNELNKGNNAKNKEKQNLSGTGVYFNERQRGNKGKNQGPRKPLVNGVNLNEVKEGTNEKNKEVNIPSETERKQ
ncbi:uncharacterized protein PGTG_19380 [Puccinia graminis f. sp. tritici CRL 75-36-700-3]|uniref:Uncharacterized protein n=1 Tax=Puccinia graminis f. sp. tritici (strain CRL 75-36-700-3 / race SCCL) TaxID=418459 RepID=E3LA93_PUCGT|nr:uncharacterized protein PGTG_19380 [Puccinia graminis f. sp. tritici CRL 75-36-700-3]EFP93468.2 hypothetical protein PGTG_19380 [Puccinia graminis f. sp. tritici CRL 75-36-700-3]